MFITQLFLFILVTICLACESPSRIKNQCSAMFKSSNIVPEIIPEVAPNFLYVYYSSVEICCGTEIAQTQSIIMPKVTYAVQPNTNYSLFLIDVDVPSPHTPSLRSALYWAVVNIPGNDTDAGFTVTPYVPPTVYPDSGLHRFVFLVYAQKNVTDVTDSTLLNLATSRTRFSVSQFNKERNNTLEAGNFFTMRVKSYGQNNYCQA